jgi:RNA polymerase sigma-70 factor (ECF subfamily)
MITTEGIWQELHTNLRAFIARRVPSEDVDDILQDVFVRVHRRLATLAQQERVQAWVYQITRNAITDYYRLRSRPVGVGPEAAPVEPLVEWPEDDEAHAAAVRSELATCLEPLVRQLPNTYREAVLLADFARNGPPRVGDRLSGAWRYLLHGRRRP